MHSTWACFRIRHCVAQTGRPWVVGSEVGDAFIDPVVAIEFVVDVATF